MYCSGVLSNIFGRFWRPQSTSEPETSGPTKFYLDDGSANDEKEDVMTGDPQSGDAPARIENSSSNISNAPQLRGNGKDVNTRLSPSPSGNSLDSDGKQAKFSEKLASMFKAGAKPGLIDYNRSNFRQYWMPDSTGKECYQCEERFSTFRRRHHCRLCGQIFCAKCCNIHVPGSALGTSFSSSYEAPLQTNISLA
ncbi:FYVE zinc finger [Cooperia oncophora]